MPPSPPLPRPPSPIIALINSDSFLWPYQPTLREPVKTPFNFFPAPNRNIRTKWRPLTQADCRVWPLCGRVHQLHLSRLLTQHNVPIHRPQFDHRLFSRHWFHWRLFRRPRFCRPLFCRPILRNQRFRRPCFNRFQFGPLLYCRPLIRQLRLRQPIFRQPRFRRPLFCQPLLRRHIFRQPRFCQPRFRQPLFCRLQLGRHGTVSPSSVGYCSVGHFFVGHGFVGPGFVGHGSVGYKFAESADDKCVYRLIKIHAAAFAVFPRAFTDNIYYAEQLILIAKLTNTPTTSRPTIWRSVWHLCAVPEQYCVSQYEAIKAISRFIHECDSCTHHNDESSTKLISSSFESRLN